MKDRGFIGRCNMNARETLLKYRMLRASRVRQCKAQSADHGGPIAKGCNVAMTNARSSRRARRTGLLAFVVLLGNGPTMACECTRRNLRSRYGQSKIGPLAKRPVRHAERSILNQRFPRFGLFMNRPCSKSPHQSASTIL